MIKNINILKIYFKKADIILIKIINIYITLKIISYSWKFFKSIYILYNYPNFIKKASEVNLQWITISISDLYDV